MCLKRKKPKARSEKTAYRCAKCDAVVCKKKKDKLCKPKKV